MPAKTVATPWIIFDGDNTLWPVEYLYDNARLSLCSLLEARGLQFLEVESFQQARDKELYKTYGYSACRFARSFEDTILHFLPTASDDDVQHVRGIAMSVLEEQAEIVPGLPAVLARLSEHYTLGIITAGERWVQERRLQHFHLRTLFAAVEIVERKSESVFLQYSDKKRRGPGKIVGDWGQYQFRHLTRARSRLESHSCSRAELASCRRKRGLAASWRSPCANYCGDRASGVTGSLKGLRSRSASANVPTPSTISSNPSLANSAITCRQAPHGIWEEVELEFEGGHDTASACSAVAPCETAANIATRSAQIARP
jgi:phosphoglycolate phosphatase-like HAD superfamily hydrolase